MTRYIFILLLLSSCAQPPKPKSLNPYLWYSQTKSFILYESSLPADSTSTEKYPDGKPHKVKSFYHGHPTVERWYRETGEQIAQTNFSSDGQLELRKEICKDGKPSFEGIFYKEHAYGPSTWWKCDNYSIIDAGVRYKDREIGIWRHRDDKGNVTETNYEHDNLIDSLVLIHGVDD